MLGDKIKQIRKDKKISQKDFAEILEIPVSTLANYENNHREPSIDTVYKISNALGISPLELFPDSNTTNTSFEYQNLGTDEFKTLALAHKVKDLKDEKDMIIIPFIKHINSTYLNSKYDIDKLLHTNPIDLVYDDCDYAELKLLLIDIIDIRLSRYSKKKNLSNKNADK